KTPKAFLHDIRARTSATRIGVTAPPQRAQSQRMPWARTFSSGRSHVANARVRLGKQPASPIPKRKRVTMRELTLRTHPVAAVKRDHQTTTRISVFRGPNRSPSQPVGISKRA